jgi:hypothetical protein
MPGKSQIFTFSTGIDSQGNATKREIDSNKTLIRGSSITYPPETKGAVTYYSEPLMGDGYYGGTGLHTVNYIPWPKQGENNTWVLNNFTGTIVIQATLASDPQENDWFDVNSTYSEFTNTEYDNVLHNFRGNFVWIRAKVVIFAGVLQQIAYNH